MGLATGIFQGYGLGERSGLPRSEVEGEVIGAGGERNSRVGDGVRECLPIAGIGFFAHGIK